MSTVFLFYDKNFQVFSTKVVDTDYTQLMLMRSEKILTFLLSKNYEVSFSYFTYTKQTSISNLNVTLLPWSHLSLGLASCKGLVSRSNKVQYNAQWVSVRVHVIYYVQYMYNLAWGKCLQYNDNELNIYSRHQPTIVTYTTNGNYWFRRNRVHMADSPTEPRTPYLRIGLVSE